MTTPHKIYSTGYYTT